MTPETAETQREAPVRQQQSASCGGCPARWSRTRIAHCGACHRTFSTVGNFDRHRSNRGKHGACLDPVTVGMVERDFVWGMPPPDPTKTRADWWNKNASESGGLDR
jgi:hypothetical protein